MLKPHQFLFITPLLLIILLSLSACSPKATNKTTSNYNDETRLIKGLEQALNFGEVDKALSLFSDAAELIEVNPTYLLSVDGTGIFYTRYLTKNVQVSYKGKPSIETYLFTLINYKFQSSNSYFDFKENQVIWECQIKLYDSRLRIEVKATLEDQKITSLTITNLEMTPL